MADPISQYDKSDPRSRYDEKNEASILKYALKLQEQTLRLMVKDLTEDDARNKGGFGNLVQSKYFGIPVNSRPEPDFVDAGVELKVTPVKRNKKRFAAKERVPLGLIDYMKEHKLSFEESSFWKKNKRLLLLHYLDELDGVSRIDMLFKLIYLHSYPDEDIEIIKGDWQKIIDKIKSGRAHELSEGDTMYLAATTKGSKGYENATLREQPEGPPASQRAFSLKPSYMNILINRGGIQKSFVPIVSLKELRSGKTFEELIVAKFKPYLGKTQDELKKELEIPETKAKHIRAIISFAIMGAKGKTRIEEFEKANATLKTVLINSVGTPTEDMSFAQINYEEIAEEDWEDSAWYTALSKKFLFVIFDGDEENPTLSKAFFWNMPVTDLEAAKRVWEDTREKIKNNDFDNFLLGSQTKATFIRTKGRNKKDVRKTPSGGEYKKLGYWFWRGYIKQIVASHAKNA